MHFSETQANCLETFWLKRRVESERDSERAMPLATSRKTTATRPPPPGRVQKLSGSVSNGKLRLAGDSAPAENAAVTAIAPFPLSLKDSGGVRDASTAGNGEAIALTPQPEGGGSSNVSAPVPLKDSDRHYATHSHDDQRARRLMQQQHLQMLDDMDRKARELCDDTRRQYELLLQRQEASHERQLQALQQKLKEVLSSSISLSEHRQALSEMARAHERDTRALIKVHDDETAQLHRRCKQIANTQQVSRSRAFQEEKDFLLDKIAQLEMDRNGALRQWREEELIVLSVRTELEEVTQAKILAETKLQEACQHIVGLKAQLPKIDRVGAKLKAERAAHAASVTTLQERLTEASEAKGALTTRVGVLESELEHLRSMMTSQLSELVDVKSALTVQVSRVAELQKALAEATTKETLLKEFRDNERAAHEAQRSEWHASLERLQTLESDARKQISVLQQEKQVAEVQCQLLTRDVARVTDERVQSEQVLVSKLRALHTKYAAAKKQVAQLQTQQAELQDEERVNQLLFAGRR